MTDASDQWPEEYDPVSWEERGDSPHYPLFERMSEKDVRKLTRYQFSQGECEDEILTGFGVHPRHPGLKDVDDLHERMQVMRWVKDELLVCRDGLPRQLDRCQTET